MTSWTTPKVDWTASDGLSMDDMNRIESNTAHLKEQSTADINNLTNHVNDGTVHKTSEVIRAESTTPFYVEVRTSDPASPGIGRMWLNTSV